MSRQTTISLAGAAAVGVGLLGMCSAVSAAPVNGAIIGKAASAEELTQNVAWRGRGVGWHGVGWRPGLRGGVAWHGAGWRGVGWRPGLAAAGLAATGLAAAAAYNTGYGNYGYGSYYGPGAYTVAPGYGYAATSYGYGAPSYSYTAAPSYGYTTAQNYGYGGYGNYYGGYGQPGYGAAAMAPAANPTPAATPAPPTARTAYRGNRGGNKTASGRWTRNYCINAVHERLGVSSADAGKNTNRDAVLRCMQRGPMAIG